MKAENSFIGFDHTLSVMITSQTQKMTHYSLNSTILEEKNKKQFFVITISFIVSIWTKKKINKNREVDNHQQKDICWWGLLTFLLTSVIDVQIIKEIQGKVRVKCQANIPYTQPFLPKLYKFHMGKNQIHIPWLSNASALWFIHIFFS